MTLALSDPTKGLDPLKVPMTLQRLFAPLVETQYDPAEPDNPFCRLCHSTVRKFLEESPDVLGTRHPSQGSPRQAHVISGSRIGNLCLRYLSLKRYSKLLDIRRGGCQEPLVLLSDDSKEDSFLPYCAKFWVKHLDDLEPTPELHRELSSFLRSPNFQILIQAQSLLVKGQFSMFSKRAMYSALPLSTPCIEIYIPSPLDRSNVIGSLPITTKLIGTTDKFSAKRTIYRSVFPRWFGDSRAKDPKLTDEEFRRECSRKHQDYRHFVAEWGYQLRRSTCESLIQQGVPCRIEHFFGEVDRCLSGLLGPTHFMNSMKEKYPSFMLIDEPFEYHESKQTVIAEGVSASAYLYTVISLPSQSVGFSSTQQQ